MRSYFFEIVFPTIRASQIIKPMMAARINAKITPALKASSINPQPDKEIDKVNRVTIENSFLISGLLPPTRQTG